MPGTILPGGSSTGEGLTSLAFPLALPLFPAPSSVVPSMGNQSAVLQSPFTKSTQVQEWDGEGWSFDVTLPTMDENEAAAWCATMAALRGRGGTFLMRNTFFPFGRGVVDGAPKVNGAGQSGRRLVTNGWTSSSPLVRRSGDYIQVGSGAAARMHMVLLDVNADSSGNVTLDLWPALREAPAHGSMIVVNYPAVVCRLTSNDRKFSVDSVKLYGLQFSCEEAL